MLCCPARSPFKASSLLPGGTGRSTSAALAAKNAQGATLDYRTNLPAGQAKGIAPNAVTAEAFSANFLPVIRQIQATGATTYRAIAAALNARGIRSPRGGE
jgi:hypothetical protein